MNDDLQRLEESVTELSERLRRMEARVLALEGGSQRLTSRRSPADGVAATDAVASREGATPRIEAREVTVTIIISYAGRSLMVLGGAFLLRWLTQSGYLPQLIGSIIGMIYALLWIALADRTAGRGRRRSAVFHAVTGTFIAFPLIVEATTKFHFLTPAASAVSLLALVVVGLAVAGRRKLRVLAWIVAVPAAPLVFVLGSQTKTMTPFLLSLLVLGFVTLWLGYLRRWQFLATLMAAAADLGMALMIMERVMNADRPDAQQLGLAAALFLLLALIVIYFGSYCFRVFRRRRTITPLEMGQMLAAMVIGFGGAALMLRAEHLSMRSLGIVSLVLSAACYTASYGFLPRRDPNRRNFLFFTLLGLTMVLLGGELALPSVAAVVVFSILALISGAIAKRIASPVLYLHGAVYLIAAIIGSHLVGAIIDGFVGSSVSIARWADGAVLFALAVTMAYPWFPRPSGRKVDVYLGRRSVDAFVLVGVLAMASVIVAVIAAVVPVGTDATYQGAIASARTGVLALVAVFLAWVCCRVSNLVWLVYAILVLGGIKLVFQDIRAGGAATLFLSFGFYGGALILAPRFLRSSAAGRRQST